MSFDRRTFLIRGAAAGAALAGPFQALLARADGSHGNGQGHAHGNRADYGPLFPILDETTGLPLLLLPEGFKYVSFGWTRDPMEGGIPTPGSHDGMAALPGPQGR